jgi:hypothetical protein
MPSLADWIGSVLYLFIGIVALAASRRAPTRRSRRHWRFITIFIIALIPWRLLQLEEAMRGTLRAALVTDKLYSARTDLQAPIAAGVIGLGAIAMGAYAAQAKSRPWQLSLSGLAIGAMLSLIVIRLVSLHMFDRLIYASIGPFRLHYFAESALLIAIGWAALSPEHTTQVKNFTAKSTEKRHL